MISEVQHSQDCEKDERGARITKGGRPGIVCCVNDAGSILYVECDEVSRHQRGCAETAWLNHLLLNMSSAKTKSITIVRVNPGGLAVLLEVAQMVRDFKRQGERPAFERCNSIRELP
jgi:hypothetical protein